MSFRSRALPVSLGIAALVAVLSLTACGCSDSSTTSGGDSSASSGGGESFDIVMSNGFVSQWRTQMEQVAEVMAAENEPYKGHVNFKRVVSETSPTAQIQSINNIIAEEPDAILIDALSPTALNPVAEKACAKGIVVIFFDQIGSADCSYTLHEPEYELFKNNAEWLAKTLHGKGQILEDLGLAGSPISLQ